MKIYLSAILLVLGAASAAATTDKKRKHRRRQLRGQQRAAEDYRRRQLLSWTERQGPPPKAGTKIGRPKSGTPTRRSQEYDNYAVRNMPGYDGGPQYLGGGQDSMYPDGPMGPEYLGYDDGPPAMSRDEDGPEGSRMGPQYLEGEDSMYPDGPMGPEYLGYDDGPTMMGGPEDSRMGPHYVVGDSMYPDSPSSEPEYLGYNDGPTMLGGENSGPTMLRGEDEPTMMEGSDGSPMGPTRLDYDDNDNGPTVRHVPLVPISEASTMEKELLDEMKKDVVNGNLPKPQSLHMLADLEEQQHSV